MQRYLTMNKTILQECVWDGLISFSLSLHTCCGSQINLGFKFPTLGVDGGLVGAARCQMVKPSLCGVWGQSLVLYSWTRRHELDQVSVHITRRLIPRDLEAGLTPVALHVCIKHHAHFCKVRNDRKFYFNRHSKSRVDSTQHISRIYFPKTGT